MLEDPSRHGGVFNHHLEQMATDLRAEAELPALTDKAREQMAKDERFLRSCISELFTNHPYNQNNTTDKNRFEEIISRLANHYADAEGGE